MGHETSQNTGIKRKGHQTYFQKLIRHFHWAKLILMSQTWMRWEF